MTILPAGQLAAIRQKGVVADAYDRSTVLGQGAYSIVLSHAESSDLVVKLTSCTATVPLLTVLLMRPALEFVSVKAILALGQVPGSSEDQYLVVLERLSVPPPNMVLEVGRHAAAASAALLGGKRPPLRGTVEYQAFVCAYCAEMASLDKARSTGWRRLQAYLSRLDDALISVDVLTEGNLLLRGDCLVFSDPIRRMPAPLRQAVHHQ